MNEGEVKSRRNGVLFRVLTMMINHRHPESVLADYEEMAGDIARSKGERFASRWLFLQTLMMFSTWTKNTLWWRFTMIRNHLKLILRNVQKHKGYTFINVTGLAVGIACCLFILLYVRYERSYDRFYAHADRIHRIGVRGVMGFDPFEEPMTPQPMAEVLIREFPDVLSAARVVTFGYPVLRYDDLAFSEERFFFADSTFFDVFRVPFIAGDPNTALNRPDALVITESMSEKYFGDEDPLGRSLNSDNRRDYIVTGVVPDVPENSHFHYDFLASWVTLGDRERPFWINNDFYTYFTLRDGVTAEAFEPKLEVLIDRYVNPWIRMQSGMGLEEMDEAGYSYAYFVQPLLDIHLKSNLKNELEPNGSILYVRVFTFVALAILVIACINFMNLATARSVIRAKEVGIRKTLGSTRTMLIRQFLGESLMMTSAAVIAAVLLVMLLLPAFNGLTSKPLQFSFAEIMVFLPLFAGLVLGVGSAAGFYPALCLSSFRPVDVLRGKVALRGREAGLRNALVVFQFAVSILLLASTLVVFGQLNYMQGRNLGFNEEQLIIIEKSDDLGSNVRGFMRTLLEHPSILNVTNSIEMPGEIDFTRTYRAEGDPDLGSHVIYNIWTDHGFMDTYQIEMKEGRFFDAARPADSTAVILNETAVRELGMKDPVGKRIIWLGHEPSTSRTYPVIGVARDFHMRSLHERMSPLVMQILPRRVRAGYYTAVRVAPDDLEETLAFMEDAWMQVAGNQAFEYEFFDEEFTRLYSAERITGRVLSVFTGLAVFVACLGLFGLTSFMTAQRTKEIGIRKVVGASNTTIFRLLCIDIVRLVFVATLIGWPITYLLMKDWLQNFAYRVGVGFGPLIMAALAGISVALITIGYHAVKAARANPVDSLRYE